LKLDCQAIYQLLTLIPDGVALLTDVYEKFVIAEGKQLLTPVRNVFLQIDDKFRKLK
jgi:hypothetical protein